MFDSENRSVKAEKDHRGKEREDSPDWAVKIGKENQAAQILLVAAVGETTAYISMHEKSADGKWKEMMSTPGYIGKCGLGKEKEGDGKTPVGTFYFNCAFGIADDPGCSAFEYRKVTNEDYWSGDMRDGYHYNQMVNLRELPDLDTDSSEHILDYRDEYQYALNISYNVEGISGLGSAIFLHCFQKQKTYTGGCVAIPRDKMETVMINVKKDCVVVIDSLEKISPGLWKEWETRQGA